MLRRLSAAQSLFGCFRERAPRHWLSVPLAPEDGFLLGITRTTARGPRSSAERPLRTHSEEQ